MSSPASKEFGGLLCVVLARQMKSWFHEFSRFFFNFCILTPRMALFPPPVPTFSKKQSWRVDYAHRSRFFRYIQTPGWYSVVRNSSQGSEVEDWKWSLVSSLQLEEAACTSSPADQLPSSPPHVQMLCYLCMCVTFVSWRQSWRNSCCPNWRNSHCQNWRNSPSKNRLNFGNNYCNCAIFEKWIFLFKNRLNFGTSRPKFEGWISCFKNRLKFGPNYCLNLTGEFVDLDV